MDNHSNESTLQVQGFTPYAQIPRWILRHQGNLSAASVNLYGVLMTYADNSTRAAFPGREKLAEDMGVKVRSISTYIKELEEFGALKVTRRRNKRTGNFYANHYVLVFEEPCAESCTPPDAQDYPVTTPTVELDSPSCTSDQRSDTTVARAHSVSTPAQSEPGDLPGPLRARLRRRIVSIGQEISKGHSYWSDHVLDMEAQLVSDLETYCQHLPGIDGLIDAFNCGKITIGAKEADPYHAGAKLNTLINMAPLQP